MKEVTGWKNAELARQAGVSRTTPTDWTNGKSQVMSSTVAQALSQKTPFTANWLATGSKPMYKAEFDVKNLPNWPFAEIDETKIRALDEADRDRLEGAILHAADVVGLDITKD